MDAISRFLNYKCHSPKKLADAQLEMNEEATTSPLDPIPLPLLAQGGDILRACILGMINVSYTWGELPQTWSKVPVAPIPKPGKPTCNFDSYRPIYLLSGLFKLYDKMLFKRIKPAVQAQSGEWQSGGARGADQAAWLLDATLRARRRQHDGGKTWIAFLDAEAAYCRPPRPYVLQGLADAGIAPRDWLAIRSILRSIRGCAKIHKQIVGDWEIQTGVPQGGSLSSPLFQTTLPSLQQELKAAKCGVWIDSGDGRRTFVSCLGYVDDLALLADSPKMLRRALKIAEGWARKLHIRWNIGVNKSAIMLWGRGKRSHAEDRAKFRISGQAMPVVTTYKYLGVLFSNGGGAGEFIAEVRRKTLKRTQELKALCNQRACPLHVSERLWRMYVQPAAMYAIGTMSFTPCQTETLDIIQREAGRILLDFHSRSPTPAVLAELGWTRWAHLYNIEVVRLLSRNALEDNVIISALLKEAEGASNCWTGMAAKLISPWCNSHEPSTRQEWYALVQAMATDLRSNDMAQIIYDVGEHHNLGMYRPTKWLMDGTLGVNMTLHHCKIPRNAAIAVRRLIVGGQGLRGGDPVELMIADRENCCLHCLWAGSKVAETLQHVIFHCPLYATTRSDIASELTEGGTAVLELSRDRWTWPQLRRIVRFLHSIWQQRDSYEYPLDDLEAQWG